MEVIKKLIKQSLALAPVAQKVGHLPMRERGGVAGLILIWAHARVAS